DRHDVPQRAAHELEHAGEVAHHLVRLLADAVADERAVEIRRHLPRHVEGLPGSRRVGERRDRRRDAVLWREGPGADHGKRGKQRLSMRPCTPWRPSTTCVTVKSTATLA